MDVLALNDGVLISYFYSWRPYKLIVERIKEVHGLNRSLSWLRKQFKRLCLSRRPQQYTPNTIVSNCIRKELKGSMQSVGYRTMWKVLRERYFLITKRSTVMQLMRLLDKDGVRVQRSRRLQRRRYVSKGPNYVWHIDGYDKLKQFGFAIHGCVDGFSRKIIWIRVASTNNDPKVIARYYLEAVEEKKGFPTKVRMDCGTENVRVATIQYAFSAKNNGTDTAKASFLYGTSHANVRVESMWAQLRKALSGWWMRVFKEMRDQELFNCGNITHKRCLAIIFSPIIERELNSFKVCWNSHRIRKSNVDCVDGVPDDLYQMPSYYGTEDYLQPVNSSLWVTAMQEESTTPEPLFSSELYDNCAALVRMGLGIDLHRDINMDNCIDVFLYLLNNM